MTRAVPALALLSVAFLAGGCDILGSPTVPPPKPLSEARYTYLVHRSTTKFVCGIERRGKATNPAQARANLANVVSRLDRWLVTLRRLTPPAREAVAVQRLLGALDRLDGLIHDIADAVALDQFSRAKALVKRVHRATKRFDRQFHVHHRGRKHHPVCAKS